MSAINIGIIGVGGVGGYFGGKLCHSLSPREANFFFLARGGHKEEIHRNGLRVSTLAEGEWTCRPTLVTDSFEDFPVLDVCLICVKSYDLPPILRGIQGRISDETIITPLLNGVDVYERIRESFVTGKVLPACVYVGTHIEAPGKVRQNGGACKIFMGKDPLADTIIPRRLFDLFDRSGIQYEWIDDVYPEIWKKFIFIAAFGLVTAAFDKTLGQVMESKMLGEYVRSMMRETFALSHAQGVALPEETIINAYRKGYDFPPETKTSFQRDYERADKPDERDLFGGTILRLGLLHGIDTPVTRELYEILMQRKPLAGEHSCRFALR